MSVVSIEPAKLLRELHQLWSGLGREETGGVLRACLMTLIVVTDDESGDASLGTTLGELMRDFPSRAILVRFTGAGERRVEAKVTAQCWLPFGSRRQICSEQIEIAASVPAMEDLPGLLRGLMAADLPVVVWHRGTPGLPVEALKPVFALAGKVLVDTAGAASPAAGLASVRWLADRGPLVADLSWTRLTRWRETAARVYTAQGAGAPPRAVTVLHYGGQPPVRAVYLRAWLRQAFGEGPVYRFQQAPDCEGYPGGEVAGVELAVGDRTLSIVRADATSVEVRLDGLVTRKLFPELAEHDVLREELGITGPDPVYRRTLAVALGS